MFIVILFQPAKHFFRVLINLPVHNSSSHPFASSSTCCWSFKPLVHNPLQLCSLLLTTLSSSAPCFSLPSPALLHNPFQLCSLLLTTLSSSASCFSLPSPALLLASHYPLQLCFLLLTTLSSSASSSSQPSPAPLLAPHNPLQLHSLLLTTLSTSTPCSLLSTVTQLLLFSFDSFYNIFRTFIFHTTFSQFLLFLQHFEGFDISYNIFKTFFFLLVFQKFFESLNTIVFLFLILYKKQFFIKIQ